MTSWFRTKKQTPVLIAIFAVVVLFTRLSSGCTPQNTSKKPLSVPLPPPTVSPAPLPLEITPYFTNPAMQGKDAPGRKIIKTMVDDINSATHSVEIAMYNYNQSEISEALIKAFHRGVEVRMVVDSDALDNSELRRLMKTGIKVLGDRRESLMHNKFVIIDKATVWTGSLNLTDSGSMQDENVQVRIRSKELAENYQSKFNEMFTVDKFGPESRPKTAITKFTLSGTAVENYYSPEDAIDSRLVSLVGSAQKSVHILAYSFTLDRLADALIKAAKNDVQVSGVFDEESTGSNQGADFSKLKKAGLDVRLDGEEGFMHIKAIIVDGKTVAFGSYNFTASAENKNDENILIITDPVLAVSFEKEFDRIYQKSKP